MATPVQRFTQDYVANSQLFNTAYHLYSETDMTQVMDPQGLQYDSKHWPCLYPLFSERHFPHPNSPKFIQAELKIGGRSFEHNDFTYFKDLLPTIIALMDKHKPT